MGGVPQQVGTVCGGRVPERELIKAVSCSEGMLDYPAPPLATPENARNYLPSTTGYLILFDVSRAAQRSY